jgi:mono/diheme cytochrome c family protein
MDLPLFNAAFFGNRLLVAMIAIVHVWINHAFAVGMAPLVVSLEWWAWRHDRPEWDELARRILSVAFVVTTSVGALTGVGIWLVTSVVNPYAIGSLLRVFFWAWFTEWIVFVTEVVLILVYFLTWKRMRGARKLAHIRIGLGLAFASWATMAIIVGILGYMMNPGNWLDQASLVAGFTNPDYLPQLLFRTPAALAMAGSLALGLTPFFTERGSRMRAGAVRVFSGWILFWLVPAMAGGLVYYEAVPAAMRTSIPVAFATQAYAPDFRFFLMGAGGLLLVSAVTAAAGLVKPLRLTAVTWVIPLVALTVLVGYFERTREFIRKPYVIGYYMFSNGIRVGDVPYLLKSGVLANAAWTTTPVVTPQNQLEAGRNVFGLLCNRCHTIDGVNAITRRLATLYPPPAAWDPAAIDAFLKSIHGARPYMPPFVGTPQERAALAAFLASLQPGFASKAAGNRMPAAEASVPVDARTTGTTATRR